MKLLTVCIGFSFMQYDATSNKKDGVNLMQRISLLKQRIEEDIEETRFKAIEKNGGVKSDLRHLPKEQGEIVNEEYEYVETHVQPGPITPIPRKHAKRSAKKLTATSTTKRDTDALRSKRKKRRKRPVAVDEGVSFAPTPAEVFYRKTWNGIQSNSELVWTHCQDLISPFLQGQKRIMTDIKRVKAKDNIVQRLVQLINVNTTTYTQEEIYSLLYQISNLHLRFFQWDVGAMKLLFYTITKGSRVTFRTMKTGLKALFNKWHLDFSNITALVKETRLFRPPCIRITDYAGSTKTSKAIRYSKTTLAKQCHPNDYSEECIKITIKY